MKRFNSTVWVIGCLAFVLVMSGTGQARLYPNQSPPEPFIIEGRVTIQFEDDVEFTGFSLSSSGVRFGLPVVDVALEKYQVSVGEPVFPSVKEKPAVNSGLADLTRFYEIQFPKSFAVQDVIDELMASPNVRVAEPVWGLPELATPDDPAWTKQWHMRSASPTQVMDGWDFETGSDSIIIAILDGGANWLHQDLNDALFVNPGEDLDGDGVVFDSLDDINYIDDDGNGIIDDLIGWDFFSGGFAVWPGEDGGTPDPNVNDFSGHGTHVSGIAAGETNNGYMITGVAGGWAGGSGGDIRARRGCRILPMRASALRSDGMGVFNSTNIAQAIYYAITMGAHIINNSWGGGNSGTISAAFNNAIANGINIIKAAGNDDCVCPDGYASISGLINVASTDAGDHKAGSSTYGWFIDVSAPGQGILSTVSWQYVPDTATFSGTSMSSPYVAGLAGLIRSMMPSLSKAQVDSIFINTADNIDAINPGYEGQLGSGRVNVYRALKDLANAKFSADITEGNVPLAVQFTDESPNSPVAWDWNMGDGATFTTQNPSHTYTTPGIYDVSLRIDENHPLGPGEEHLKRYIWAQADSIEIDSVFAERGTQVMLPVYLASTALITDIQFSFNFPNSSGVTWDSFSVAGLRTEYFHSVQLTTQVPSSKKYVINMIPSPSGESRYLPPDTGAILKLYFDIASSGTDAIVTIDTLTVNGKSPRIGTIYGDYFPVFKAGKINLLGCAHGDVDGNGTINVADLTALVDYLFGEGFPICERGADVNGFMGINVADLTYLVDYLFNNGPPPPA